MKKLSIILTSIFVFATLGCGGYVAKSKRIYPQPENLAQKVANYIAAHTIPDSEDGLTLHEQRFYKDDSIYEVQVWHEWLRNETSLTLNYYQTTEPMEELSKSMSTPADALAHEFIWGTPGITKEIHISDDNLDGAFDYHQLFVKTEDGYFFDDFTREERDMGEAAGVDEYLIYSDGKIFKNDKEITIEEFPWCENHENWLLKLECVLSGCQEDYESLLQEFANHFKIK